MIIEGGATNKSFVLDLLDQPEVIDASADTGWIDRVRGEGRLVTHRHSAVALAAAAIEAYEEEERVERQRLLSTAHGGRPQVQHDSGRPLDLKLRGVGYRIRVARVGAHRFRVGIETGAVVRTADVELDRFDRHTGQIVVNGIRYRLLTGTYGPTHLVEVDGVTHRGRWSSSSAASATASASPASASTGSASASRRRHVHRRRRDRAVRRAQRPDPGQRQPLPPRHRHARPDPPGRGRRRHPPVSRDEGGVVRSPAPALVVATPLEVGDEVEAGAPVLVLESMKMETVLRAPFKARLRECPSRWAARSRPARRCCAWSRSRTTPTRPRPTRRTEAVELDLPAEPPRTSRRTSAAGAACEDLRSLLLGFDVDPHDDRRVLDELPGRAAAELEPVSGRWPAKLDLLDGVRRPRRAEPQPAGGEDGASRSHVHSPREYFHTYLQSLDVERAGLPDAFQTRLGKVLGHYGVDRPGPHARAGSRRLPDLPRPAAGVRRRRGRRRRCCAQWLPETAAGRGAARARRPRAGAPDRRHPGPLPGGRATSPAAWCSAGSPSRCCAATAPEVYAEVRGHLRHLDAQPGRAGPRRADRRDGRQRRAAGPAARPAASAAPGRDHAPLLEVLTRRYYGNRGADRRATARRSPGCRSSPPSTTATASVRLVAAAVDFAALAERRSARSAELADATTDAVVADIYLDLGRTSRGLRRDGGARWREVLAAHAAAAAGPPGHHHRRRPQRRGDAPPLHLPARRAPASPRTG